MGVTNDEIRNARRDAQQDLANALGELKRAHKRMRVANQGATAKMIGDVQAELVTLMEFNLGCIER